MSLLCSSSLLPALFSDFRQYDYRGSPGLTPLNGRRPHNISDPYADHLNEALELLRKAAGKDAAQESLEAAMKFSGATAIWQGGFRTAYWGTRNGGKAQWLFGVRWPTSAGRLDMLLRSSPEVM